MPIKDSIFLILLRIVSMAVAASDTFGALTHIGSLCESRLRYSRISTIRSWRVVRAFFSTGETLLYCLKTLPVETGHR